MASQQWVLAINRKTAPCGDHDRCCWQQLHQPGVIQGRLHDQQFQIIAQPLLYIEQQRQRQISLWAEFMELVEDHQW